VGFRNVQALRPKKVFHHLARGSGRHQQIDHVKVQEIR
jgi:hypothetical protein